MQDYDAHQAKMTKAFEAVQNADHWKGRIDTTLTTEQVEEAGGLDTIREAIAHFTATGSYVTHGIGNVRIQAAGYWEGPAS